MVHYEPVTITIDFLGLVEIIISMVVQHYDFQNFIVID